MTEPNETPVAWTEVGLAPDLESRLSRMAEIKALERDLKTEYEVLRDVVVAEDFEGSQYFISHDGTKRRGYISRPEKVLVDEDALFSALPDDVLDEVAPRALNRKAFTQAVKTERISGELFAQTVRLVDGTPHVRFDSE